MTKILINQKIKKVNKKGFFLFLWYERSLLILKRDYYSVLGVSKDTKKEEIKKAYCELAKKYHPDMNAMKSKKAQAKAENKLKEANEAYAILSDSEKQKEYDRGQTNPSTSQQEIDFSEIEEHDNKIQEYAKILEILYQERIEYSEQIVNEQKNIKLEVKQLREMKTNDKGFLDALKYIERFKKRDAALVTRLTITNK